MLPKKLLFVSCIITLSTFTLSLRFDYYKTDNPGLTRRVSSEEGHKDDAQVYYISGRKNNEGSKHKSFKDSHNKGLHDREESKKDFGDDGGHKGDSFDEKQAGDANHAKSENQKAGKFHEKKGHKKGHKTKGWHNTFFRDEFHKEHRFYDNADKRGSFEKHGNLHQKYKKSESGRKKGGSKKSATMSSEQSKKGQKVRGHNVQDHRGHSHKQGDQYRHHNNEKYGKQGNKHKGQHYAYKSG